MYIIDQNNMGTLCYLFTNHLGSPNLITDASGNTVQELSFDACLSHSTEGEGKRPVPVLYAANSNVQGINFYNHVANSGMDDPLINFSQNINQIAAKAFNSPVIHINSNNSSAWLYMPEGSVTPIKTEVFSYNNVLKSWLEN